VSVWHEAEASSLTLRVAPVGDRKASPGISLSGFHFQTKFGRHALKRTYAAIVGEDFNYEAGLELPLPDTHPTEDAAAALFHTLEGYVERLDLIGGETDEQIQNDMTNIPRFLNRLLGVPLGPQNAWFDYFAQNLRCVLAEAKKSGNFDRGVETIGGEHETLALAPGKQIRTVYCDP